MRYSAILLALGLLVVGCGLQQRQQGKKVRFQLSEPTVEIDTTSYGWNTTTTQEIVAQGPDSAATYLVLARAEQGVSMRAGEKPENEKIAVVVSDGRGTLERTTVAQRCDDYSDSGCLEKWVDPEHSFTILGYVPLSEVSQTKVNSRQAKRASKSESDLVDLGLETGEGEALRAAFLSSTSPTSSSSSPEEEEADVDSLLAELGIVNIEDFTYREKTDEITGETTQILLTSANSASLIWRCSEDGAEVYVSPDEYLGDGPITTRYRFDEQDPRGPQGWSASTDGDAAFVPDRTVMAFTDRAKGAQEVAIRVEDYGGTGYTYTFSLMGLTQGLQKMNCFQ